VVEGLLEAADMVEFAAAQKARVAIQKEAAGEHEGAVLARALEQELRGVAAAIRGRAMEVPTGRYKQIGDPGPGWMKQKRRKTGSRPTKSFKIFDGTPPPEMTGDTTKITRRRRSPKSIWKKIFTFWK
jgi:hypothetical protein